MAKKRRRRRKKNHRVYALVTLVLAIAIIVIGFGLLFYVQKIEVSGNDYTENEMITESMQKDTLSFNSVYLLVKYRFLKHDTPKSLDSMKVSLKSPWTVKVTVKEKTIIGYLDEGSEYAYFDKDGKIDFDDKSVTENTRVSYPIDHIENIVRPISSAPAAQNVIFLSADAFGVLPPVSILTPEQTQYYFLSGFTAKLAGTERGITEPQPTFSTLFGEPFMPMDPSVYANMLGERIEKYNTKVYLVNTGWTGGPYGVGSRMKLKYTRAMVTAALNGTFDDVEYKHDEVFNVDIPQTCPNVPSEIMNPRDTWEDKAAYDAQAKKLAKMFQDNFTKKYPNMPKNIAEAGPKAD